MSEGTLVGFGAWLENNGVEDHLILTLHLNPNPNPYPHSSCSLLPLTDPLPNGTTLPCDVIISPQFVP